MKTFPMVAASSAAQVAATSTGSPLARASAAAHTQQPTPNDAVPVSTSRTGMGLPDTARRALLSVPDNWEPMWMDVSALPDTAAGGTAQA